MRSGLRWRSAPQIAAALVLVSLAGRATAAGGNEKEPGLLLQGTTGKPVRLSESEFKKLPHSDVEAVDHNGQKVRYSGVPLRVLFDKVGVPRGKNLRGEWLGAFLAVDAVDGYRAVFSLAELDPEFSDRTILLADSRDGLPLRKGRGPFQVVVPLEKRQARWIWGVTELRVINSRAAKH